MADKLAENEPACGVCAAPRASCMCTPPVCKHWRRGGTCLFGDDCKFAHPAPAKGAGSARQGEPARTWQDASARGQAVRVHCSHLPVAEHADVAWPEHLLRVFSAYGTVTDAIAIKAMKSHPGLGWCTVKFASLAEANRAIQTMEQPEGAVEASGSEEPWKARGFTHLKARLPLPSIAAVDGENGYTIRSVVRVRLILGQMRRTKPKNKFRVGVFRRWLADTFGDERMRQGSGVVDVAGGKGELAFQLLNLCDIPATVVEPRPLQLQVFKQRLRRGFYRRVLPARQPSPENEDGRQDHRQEAGTNTRQESMKEERLLGEIREPCHLRVFFESWPFAGYPDSIPSSDSTGQEAATGREMRSCVLPNALWSEANFAAALDRALRATVVQGHEGDGRATRDSDESDDDGDEARCGGHGQESVVAEKDGAAHSGVQIVNFSEACALISNASLFVGMHPDQAAQAIVEYAVATGKPFAVVPCCVHPNYAAFRARRLANGAPVRTLASLTDYLKSLAPGIRTARLDFEGKNVVVYWMGPRL